MFRITNRFMLIVLICAFNLLAADGPSIEFVKLTDSIYKLISKGQPVVNQVVMVGDDGLLMIDSGTAPALEILKKELNAKFDKSVKYLINTHYHYDHTAGNIAFGKNAVIIAHPNTRKRLSSGQYLLYDLPEYAMPELLVEDNITLFFSGDTLDIIHLPGGHTDTDLVVHFKKAGIVCMGDLLFSDCFPFVDLMSGGNFDTYLANIQEMIENAAPNTIFIAGHGRDYSLEDMQNYAQMMMKTAAKVREQRDAGKTLAELQSEKNLADWVDWSHGFISQNVWMQTIFDSDAGRYESQLKNILDDLFPKIKNESIAAAIEEYRDIKKNHKDEYIFDERYLNAVGYFLLQRERIDDALEIFKLNVEEYPKAWNVYDSLAECYNVKGNRKKAIELYKKSLELNPENVNGKEMLARLESGK